MFYFKKTMENITEYTRNQVREERGKEMKEKSKNYKKILK
jgi:hypothetical protein